MSPSLAERILAGIICDVWELNPYVKNVEDNNAGTCACMCVPNPPLVTHHSSQPPDEAARACTYTDVGTIVLNVKRRTGIYHGVGPHASREGVQGGGSCHTFELPVAFSITNFVAY